MKKMIIASSLVVMTVLACAGPGQSATPPADEAGEVRWTVEADGGEDGAPQLRLEHRKSSSDLSLDDELAAKRPEFDGARAALGGSGPVRFSVRHESGVLDCSGTLRRGYDGKGTCSFAPDAAFERELAARGLAPKKRGDLFAMLIVDATVELADGLAAEGVKPKDWDQLIAAGALEVTPAFVRGFKGTSLALSDIEDAVAFRALDIGGDYVRDLNAAGFSKLSVEDATAMKALGVSGDYVRELAAAGYDNLSAEDVVGMKAMGVTGAYAKAMNGGAGAGR